MTFASLDRGQAFIYAGGLMRDDPCVYYKISHAKCCHSLGYPAIKYQVDQDAKVIPVQVQTTDIRVKRVGDQMFGG